VKVFALLAVIFGCAVVMACGDDTATEEPASVDLDVSDAPALFEEDLRRSFEGSYYVSYDLEVKAEGETHRCTVEWWKDGTERQRFDMCAPLIYGDDFEAEPWRVLMFGDER
jgi:hypothetical protein